MLFDSLRGDEQTYLRGRAAEDAPAHRFVLEVNREGLIWAVLEPSSTRAGLPRFTICRVAPSVMVMVEDAHARRQFCSTPSVAEAMEFVRAVADAAMTAAPTLHAPHPVPQ